MRHLDLFSGIGGFALAAKWVWGEEAETVAFVDYESFPQAVLKKNFPSVPVFGDIRGFRGDAFGTIDLITGGFPCQPFSQAGLRKGETDDRYLWPEMLRVIREAKPRWVVGENVVGIISMALDTVLADLEAEGYTCRTFVLPASSVGAVHRRDRVWVVAYAGSEESGGLSGIKWEALSEIGFVPENANCKRSGRRGENKSEVLGCGRTKDKATRSDSGTSNTSSTRGKRREPREPREPTQCEEGVLGRNDWGRDWYEVATAFCGVDDGLPGQMDGATLTKSKHRYERLKGLGNAIVPQVAAEIFKAIKRVDLVGAEVRS